MRILVVTNMYAESHPDQPTQGVFVTEQVEALRELYGHAIDVFVIDGHRGRSAYLRSVYRVARLVKRDAYDIVHYHFGLSACSAPLVRLFARSKIVVTFHGSDVMGKGWMRVISLAAARFSHACICVSDEISARVKKASKHCVTIPCAVNEILFKEPLDGHKVETDRKMIVFPSSPKRSEKNYPLFRDVIDQVSKIEGFSVDERHIDGLNRREVSDLLSKADCLVMTSEREGSPQSVKEAMAVNLPVVSVDVGDVGKLLCGVSHSAVVRDRDAKALANAVAKVLTDACRSEGRVRLKQLGYFSTDVAKKIGEVYESISGVAHGDGRFTSTLDRAHKSNREGRHETC